MKLFNAPEPSNNQPIQSDTNSENDFTNKLIVGFLFFLLSRAVNWIDMSAQNWFFSGGYESPSNYDASQHVVDILQGKANWVKFDNYPKFWTFLSLVFGMENYFISASATKIYGENYGYLSPGAFGQLLLCIGDFFQF